jgi:hypothetical protein
MPCTSGEAAFMEAFKDFKAYLRHVAEKSRRQKSYGDLWNLRYRDFFGYTLVYWYR